MRNRTHQCFKLNVLRQVSQAVGYLHSRSKPIVVRRLNSRNIFLEPRVILCLLDYSYQDCEYEMLGVVAIPNYLVRYTAPELFLASPRPSPSGPSTKFDPTKTASTDPDVVLPTDGGLNAARLAGEVGYSRAGHESFESPAEVAEKTGSKKVCGSRRPVTLLPEHCHLNQPRGFYVSEAERTNAAGHFASRAYLKRETVKTRSDKIGVYDTKVQKEVEATERSGHKKEEKETSESLDRSEECTKGAREHETEYAIEGVSTGEKDFVGVKGDSEESNRECDTEKTYKSEFEDMEEEEEEEVEEEEGEEEEEEAMEEMAHSLASSSPVSRTSSLSSTGSCTPSSSAVFSTTTASSANCCPSQLTSYASSPAGGWPYSPPKLDLPSIFSERVAWQTATEARTSFNRPRDLPTESEEADGEVFEAEVEESALGVEEDEKADDHDDQSSCSNLGCGAVGLRVHCCSDVVEPCGSRESNKSEATKKPDTEADV
ncbi:unnamed protein product, partial [Protopolystoma xenopodis]